MIAEIATTVLAQMQKPTLAFLIGGMVLAALGSKLEVPAPVYQFIVLLLLLKVGLGAGISVREADLLSRALAATQPHVSPEVQRRRCETCLLHVRSHAR